MFSVFKLKDSTPLSSGESHHLFEMLAEYMNKYSEDWLFDIDPCTNITYHWCHAMTGSDVLGCFSPLFPNKVFLQPAEIIDNNHTWIETTFPVIIHELRHVWQFKKCPVLYMFFNLPVIREFTIELDADHIENRAELFRIEYESKMLKKYKL